MINVKTKKRISDCFGEGHFGASRGNRTHNGIDYECNVGSLILAPASGVVTKIGYPYSNDLSFRYVEIKTEDKLKVRVFYVNPLISTGDVVKKNKTVIGKSQKLGNRYVEITEHVHLEIKNNNGEYIDPEGVYLS